MNNNDYKALRKNLRREGIMACASAIGFIFSRLYNSPYHTQVNGYGFDVCAPMFVYNLSKAFGSTTNEFVHAGLVFAVCSAGEAAQYFGLYKGTYDPKDFLAYAAGTVIALGIDKIGQRIAKKKNLKKETLDSLIKKTPSSL